MKHIPLICKIGLGLVVVELLIGVIVIAYGTSCLEVREAEAKQMLSYIRDTNPEYYARIQAPDDPSYRNDFYGNYTKVGDKRITFGGFIILLLTLSNALPVIVLFMMNYTEEEKKNKVPLNDENNQNEEVKKGS